MNEYYYHLRTRNKQPIVTVCLLTDKENIARGVSMCSLMDNPCKKVGRKISKTRAAYAMKVRHMNGHINRKDARITLASVNASCFNFKSVFDPILTEYEKKILEV